tara:strand:- start:877 stop:1374 length:498 start_codon:yes stop_codon:yes gene_type:complete
MKTYKGKFTPVNKDKYAGDYTKIQYRSLWERHVMKWCDENSQVVAWNSEEVIIPYLCETDKRVHRYFMDFLIKYKDGRTVLVEVKPYAQTLPPKTGQGRARRTVIKEVTTYVKNHSKWKEAEKYTAARGWEFVIWTEKELTAMGIMPKPLKKLKPLKPPKRRKKV